MILEAKILDPITIKLGDDSGILVAKEDGGDDYELLSQALFSKLHFGFILIYDCKGKQKEMVYSTQCGIDGVEITKDEIKIFEEGKKLPWKFDKKGKLKNSTTDDFTNDFKDNINKIIEKEIMDLEEPSLLNPIYIKISKNPIENVILKDEGCNKDLPLHPGAIIGNVHFGFVLVIDTDEGEKEIAYPTPNKIVGIGSEKNFLDNLKIYENGKYHPWEFSCDGKLLKVAAYNPYSRQDNKFIEEHSNKKSYQYIINNGVK